MLRQDHDYILQYVQKTPRYQRKFKHAIYPARVYPDPIYSQEVTIVELPFSLPFRCERVFWHASRISHRLPFYRPDVLGFFAVFTSTDSTGKALFDILFIGDQVFLIWKKWLVFVDKKTGKNLLQDYYQNIPHPQDLPDYEQHVIEYNRGMIFAQDMTLQKVMEGLLV